MFGFGMGCSFCGRRAADVEKLVGGPVKTFGRVYICDRCATQAIHIIGQHPDVVRPRESDPSLLCRIVARIKGMRHREGSRTDPQFSALNS